MSGETIYRRICDADSIDAEVSRLSREALAAVAEHLADMAPKGGVPAQIWGAVSARLDPVRRKTSKRKTQEKNPT